jgi:hypothetical protein
MAYSEDFADTPALSRRLEHTPAFCLESVTYSASKQTYISRYALLDGIEFEAERAQARKETDLGRQLGQFVVVQVQRVEARQSCHQT